MNVLNIHEREFKSTHEKLGTLIDSLASKQDQLWPTHIWPPMEFDRSLGIGAKGGHGPIRYFIEEYTLGKSIKFRFTGPKGFDGYHGYEVIVMKNEVMLLRHTLEMEARGSARLFWPLIFRPMHDALLEDSLSTAQVSLGIIPKVQRWSLWVRFLRWIISGGRARAQVIPEY